MESIGNRAYKEIKKRAKKNGVSTYQEAIKLGIPSAKTLTEWKGDGNPSGYHLQQMALAGYDVFYILTGKEKQ